MLKRTIFNQQRKIFLGILLLGLLFSSFQNCGDTQLERSTSKSANSDEITFTTPKPTSAGFDLRVLIFIDQSRSMIAGPCATDVDGDTPALKGRGCPTPPPGIDPQGQRYKMIKQWLNELKENQPSARVSLYPFSGGSRNRPLYGEKITEFKFLPLEIADPSIGTTETAETRLKKLFEEQRSDRDKIPQFSTKVPKPSDDGEPPKYMGTSVPRPQILKAKEIIKTEMLNLKNQNRLTNTMFRFIYVSDFVLKPMPSTIINAIKIVGCPDTCVKESARDCCLRPDGKLACDKETYDFCRDAGHNLSQWGGLESNDPIQLFPLLRSLLNLPKEVGGGLIKMDFILLNKDKINPKDLEKRNGDSMPAFYFLNLKALVPEGRYHESTTKAPPFNLSFSGSNSENFIVDSAQIVNLQGRVSARSRFEIDSDGDGLFDSEETKNNNPQIARSNKFCLDSISAKLTCIKTGCNPQLDEDSDGLNECEEASLGTNPLLKDTDNDGISDFYEVILGGNPIASDKELDSNGDGVDNATAMSRGAHPMADLRNIDSKDLVSFSLNQNTTNAAGQTPYSFRLKNLPVTFPRATTETMTLYSFWPLSGPIPPNKSVGSTDHSEGQNQVVFILKMRSTQNPEVRYWLIGRYEINASGSKIVIDPSQLLQLPEMGD